jgi:hypothetical protein
VASVAVVLIAASLAASDAKQTAAHHAGGISKFLGAVTNPGALSAAHRSLAGECAACHTPFRGQDAGKCVACHANERAVLERQPTSFHASIKRCGGCHVEHQGPAASITRMDHVALAVELARESKAPDASHGVPPAGPTESHRSGMSESELERGLDCNRCHANQDKHRGLFGTECAVCHATSTWRVEGYRHPSSGSKECVQCHVAPPSHYMMHFHMVSEQVVGLEHVDVRRCFLCHQTTSWNDIRGVGWYKHH